jgi:pimeloyl-ACP methyl ester carboxylesterase
MTSRTARRILAVPALLLAAAAVAAAAAYYVRNPERDTLDAAARTGATGQFITLSGGVTHYEATGLDTGRVAVLVHGFSVPYYIWDSTAVALANAGYRVIRYDVFGRGLSDRPDVAYDGTLYDNQLTELLDSLHVTAPVDLMGLSYGGYVTAHYTTTHPQRVRTLTLMDPVTTSRTVPSVMGMPVVGNWIWQVMQAPDAAKGQPSDFLHPERFPGWTERYEPQMRYRGFGRALRRSALFTGTTDYPALYSAVGRTGVPVLLVWGKQDSTVSIATAPVVRAGIPALEYLPVDSAGHLPALEQSALVHEKLLAFLAKHPT